MGEVYKQIAAVQKELAEIGISKDGYNSIQKYNFRGIENVYNTLAPLLAKHGLCILPRIIAREVVERESKHGGALYAVTVEAEFDFVAAEDGSSHTIRTFGEAMDSGDKATNKAMSAAYKYAAFMTFAIPTEGQSDADAESHEVKYNSASQPPQSGAKAAPKEKVKISNEQLDELKSLFRDLSVPEADFLEAAEIKRLSDLPKSWFEKAKKWVNDSALEARNNTGRQAA